MTNQYITRQRYQDSAVANRYDDNRFGSWRHRWKNKNTENTIARALRCLPAGGQILDLPCGTGRLIQLLERKQFHWLGGDISQEMMQVARLKTGDSRLGHGFARLDAVNLPFADVSFDAVLSIRFIQHIPDSLRDRILSEFFRVSKRWLIIEYKVYNPVLAASKKIRGKSLSYFRQADDVALELRRSGFHIKAILPVSRLASTAKIYLCEKTDAYK